MPHLHTPPRTTSMLPCTSSSGRHLPPAHVSAQPRVPKRACTLAALKGHPGTDSSPSASPSTENATSTPPQTSTYTSRSLPGLISAPSKRYTIDFTDIIEGAPRIRVRTITDRQRNQLAELAVLNERLAGRDVTETRKRIEYLKGKRRTWEAIYQYLTRTEAAATLAAIEEANRKVEAALREGSWESKSVTEMRDELEELQVQVGQAQERLQATQGRVEENLQRVQELREQAVCCMWGGASSCGDMLHVHITTTTTTTTTTSQNTLERAAGLSQASASSSVVVTEHAQRALSPAEQRRRCVCVCVCFVCVPTRVLDIDVGFLLVHTTTTLIVHNTGDCTVLLISNQAWPIFGTLLHFQQNWPPTRCCPLNCLVRHGCCFVTKRARLHACVMSVHIERVPCRLGGWWMDRLSAPIMVGVGWWGGVNRWCRCALATYTVCVLIGCTIAIGHVYPPYLPYHHHQHRLAI